MRIYYCTRRYIIVLQAGGFELENPFRHGMYASGRVYLLAVPWTRTGSSASAQTGSGSQHRLSETPAWSGSGAAAQHTRGVCIAATRRNTALAASTCGSGGRSGGTYASRQTAAHTRCSTATRTHTGISCGGGRLLIYTAGATGRSPTRGGYQTQTGR